MTKQRKLMVLGASTGQLPIICKAVELGYYVITVDYLPDNVGHQFSQHYVNCSTVDQKSVLQAAQELAIDGIVTFASDVATASVAFVAAELGLPGCPVSVAEVMSNKANFRAFQRQHRLNRPGFFTTHALAEIEAELLDLSGPLMFKPVDTSGSRGITRADVLNRENCRQAFAYAQSFARSGEVCVEEFIEGVDVSGDGFMVDGQLRSIVTQKYKRGYVPTGHSLPTNISREDQARICVEVTKTCQALGMGHLTLMSKFHRSGW
jgi:biotin carboxylase